MASPAHHRHLSIPRWDECTLCMISALTASGIAVLSPLKVMLSLTLSSFYIWNKGVISFGTWSSVSGQPCSVKHFSLCSWLNFYQPFMWNGQVLHHIYGSTSASTEPSLTAPDKYAKLRVCTNTRSPSGQCLNCILYFCWCMVMCCRSGVFYANKGYKWRSGVSNIRSRSWV